MFSVLKKLGWFFKAHWLRYTIAIVLLLGVNVIEMFPPKLLGNAIDDMKSGAFTAEGLLFYIGIFFVLTAVVYVMSYFWMHQLFGGANVMEKILRTKLMGHLLAMSPPFYEKNRTGDLMARGTNDLQAVSLTTGFGILTLVDSTMFMMTIFLTMGFLISWKLTFAAIIPLPIMAIAISLYGSKIHERFTEAQNAFGALNDRVLESVSGVRVIRAYVQETNDVRRFNEMTADVYQKNMKVAFIDSLFEPTVKLLVGASYLIGLGYGAFLVFRNELTLGELVSFNVYLGMMIWPMFAIGELINVMQRGNASLDRVNDTLSYQPDVMDSKQPVELKEPGDIVFSHVSFTYPSSTSGNIQDISFMVRKGQTVGIAGKTGSGKTTIIKQLLRQYPAGEGSITFSGVPIQQIPLDRLRGWIGYVPQDHLLFSRTVKENILYGKQDASDEEVKQAIAEAHFEKDLHMLPSGLETMVGEKGVALSGGQKQRISIARALMANPEILILDDSLSAVDAKTEAAIIRNIRENRKGKTTFILTHRLSAVEHADLILVMDGGVISERGTHQELMANNGWYREQYERQQLFTAEEGGAGA
ncbi:MULTISPECIES: multidrug ABC transporter ATP-binding protein BmrC [Bacillus]|uniref:YheI n=1 Tax=Bacillus spizizenii (strain DSM 15029 / JCM 12233 / NBRC 101239 / NRRL B-23049 / TU-B-10) TaxID=1052585 RepID=G4NUS1_BACS4|nr:multidrug ABC transporter ATP-binding protein BmrC [Bacillus spizizenii]APH67865.1 multidrug ABC transporter permease/ATP-binding protein [Bacillus subtilis]AEP85918.1 YheI [Bacillus spizizenii TU-B-10]MCI4169081.1 multidrug ABC transporter ATP-binding protein BmrC [Bacillus spizizenii]MEC1584838.1 multidrug ABC transporter ATP-binding protein BmrC [Bacillus spizizenii]GEK25478.1 putative multidrug resistance ABC transporter ATP-binding/permease protein YheI [Bacillus spizizenii]